ncbi:hypothetical protein NKW53_07635 [Acetobacter orientalis]|uniref:hypothetical protein n=1 Tax=Acetobacter orientalis TaxID=146474 RepID=UPI00209E4A84|nr:hypothetical protein [Acetobacter orientalis]MCP1215931.1 hypothetical protein [Acetobacter orientalis]MCP1217909.1 hypothetical protein [Acetobacter orientalis]
MMSVSFPEWMPLWAQLLLMAVVIVFGLGFLMMPFAVFGVKGRLAELELEIQELHADVRAISMRLASAQGVETGRLSRDMFDRAEDEPAARAVVEEIRPPEPQAKPAPKVLTPLRAPRVSDAYEARQEAPPVPHIPAERSNFTERRMPWHAKETPTAPDRQERQWEEPWQDRVPDANQLPYRPDFSRERETLRLKPSAEMESERTEPTLIWPPRKR